MFICCQNKNRDIGSIIYTKIRSDIFLYFCLNQQRKNQNRKKSKSVESTFIADHAPKLCTLYCIIHVLYILLYKY